MNIYRATSLFSSICMVISLIISFYYFSIGGETGILYGIISISVFIIATTLGASSEYYNSYKKNLRTKQ